MIHSAPLLPGIASRLTVTALVALASLTCSDQPAAVSCDLCTTSAIVEGTVRDTLGAPLPGALVGVTAHRDSCDGPSALAFTENAPGLTDTTGRYLYRLRSPMGPFSACLEVVGSLLRDTLVRGDTMAAGKPVRFLADFPAGGPRDTVVIDLVLRHE